MAAWAPGSPTQGPRAGRGRRPGGRTRSRTNAQGAASPGAKGCGCGSVDARTPSRAPEQAADAGREVIAKDLVQGAQIGTRHREFARGRLVQRHEQASTPSSGSHARGGCSGRRSMSRLAWRPHHIWVSTASWCYTEPNELVESRNRRLCRSGELQTRMSTSAPIFFWGALAARLRSPCTACGARHAWLVRTRQGCLRPAAAQRAAVRGFLSARPWGSDVFWVLRNANCTCPAV